MWTSPPGFCKVVIPATHHFNEICGFQLVGMGTSASPLKKELQRVVTFTDCQGLADISLLFSFRALEGLLRGTMTEFVPDLGSPLVWVRFCSEEEGCHSGAQVAIHYSESLGLSVTAPNTSKPDSGGEVSPDLDFTWQGKSHVLGQ